MSTRGERNNNPGNVRHVAGTTWKGQRDEQTDTSFVQFTDPVFGIRAIVRILRSYEREGLHTIQSAIDRWAPPNENNSQAYVMAVCEDCDIAPSDVVDFTDIMPKLVRAIIRHENGEVIYSDEQINQGIELAV